MLAKCSKQPSQRATFTLFQRNFKTCLDDVLASVARIEHYDIPVGHKRKGVPNTY
jgi:hypothetical protein